MPAKIAEQPPLRTALASGAKAAVAPKRAAEAKTAQNDQHTGPGSSPSVSAGAHEHLGDPRPPLSAPRKAPGTGVWTRPSNKGGWQAKVGLPELYEKVPLVGHEGVRGGHTLGKGQAGTVKLFRHSQSAAFVVLKKLRKPEAPTGKLEFELANKVDSPHIVRPFFYAEGKDGQAYVLSPLVNGVTLDAYHGGDPKVLKGALLDIFHALTAVHAAGLTHNDAGHAGNLMIDHDGRGKLIDFGTAGPLRPMAARQDLLGAFAMFDRKLRSAGVPPDLLQRFNVWLIAQKKILPTYAAIVSQPLFQDLGARG